MMTVSYNGILKNQEIFEQELAKAEDREPRTYHGLFSTHPDNDKRLQSIIKASKTKRALKSPILVVFLN